MMRHFSLGSQNSEYPRIFQGTEANQNTQKLLSTDLVNANNHYCCQLIQEKYNTVILEVPNC